MRLKRPALKHSRYYFWFVVLAGTVGGFCYLDRHRRGY